MNADEYHKVVLYELEQVLKEVDSRCYYNLADLILGAERVFLIGAGRSGLMIKAFANRLMHLRIKAFVVGDVTTPSIKNGDLLLIGSGSGETDSLVVVAQKAKRYRGKLAVITAFPGSSIGKLADLVIKVPTPSSKVEGGGHSLQPMRSLFEQSLLLFLDTVVMILMRKTGKKSNDMFTYHANLE